MRIAASILFLFLTWVSARGAELVSLEIEFREAWQDQPESSMVADFEKVTLVLGKDNHIFLGNASLALQPILTDLNTLQIRADIFGLPPKIKTSFKQVQLKKNQSLEVAQLPGKPGRLYRILFKNWQILDQKIDCEENPFDTLLWAADFSTHFDFHYLKNSLADYYWNHSKGYLESEFGRIRKFYDVYPITKLEFYYHNCPYPQANWNKELGTALFPAQKEIRVLFGPHDKLLDSPHLQILMLLNQWGYAPLFLTYGMSGYFTLNHYYTKKNLVQGKFIPLDSLFNSASYRRQDQKMAYFEAASWVRFLIEKFSREKMIEFYKEVSDINVRYLLEKYFGKIDELQKEWFKYLNEYSPLAQDLRYFAKLATGLREYPQALELYQELEQSYPEEKGTPDLANCYYILGDYSEAIQYYQKWVGQDTSDASRHYVLANMYWLKGELALARQEFEKSIALDSNSVMAYLNLAKLALDSAQYERCQSYLEKRETRKAGQQEQLEYHLLRADLHRALGQQVLVDSTALKARLLAKEILRNNQEEGFAYLLMGRAYLASDSLEQAEKYLKVAQLLEDRAFYVGQTYLLLAELYLRKGDKSMAKEYLQAVLNSPSGFREQTVARKLLARP